MTNRTELDKSKEGLRVRSSSQDGEPMLNPLDYLFDRAFDFLPKRVQWILIGIGAVLVLAVLGYFWSQGQLR
jgi:hypothetical protein